MSTFQGFEIAKSGMMTYNASMQTAAHNLANIGTKGYSRQVVKTSAQIRNVSSIKVVGSGVRALEIERIHDDYYDTKYQNVNAKYNKYTTHSYYLLGVQKYLYTKHEDDGGITTAFDQFCKRLTGTTTEAGDSTRRKEILTYADTFTSFVQEAATNLTELQSDANEEIKSCVGQINAIAEKISFVTRQINTLEAYGNPANDLRDQRTVLLDELTQYCNVETLEKEPADGVGLTQYYVYVNGGVLVDTYDVNPLKVTMTDTKKSINDIDGLYRVEWTDGTRFDAYSSSLGGKLQALFEVRDGNNTTTLEGKALEIENDKDGNLVVTMTKANINDVQLLNIPAEDGEIMIGSTTYTYKEFEVQVSENGEFTYKFTLKNKINAKDLTVLSDAVGRGVSMIVGDSVNYKGIPYYMAQLNEFVRTYAQRFNDVHKEGYDKYENVGIDVFNAKVPATGDNYIFTSKGDGYDASFSSVAKKEDNGSYTGSYYYMTAMNVCITDAVMQDSGLLAFNGAETTLAESQNLNLQRLANLKDDSKMFLHGAPDSFLQSLTADVGVDCEKALLLESGQKDVRDSVELQRQAISGADEDDETHDLITYQKMLYNQYKVLSVMNQVLDKLINQTAV